MYPRFIPAGGDVGCTTIFNSTSSNSHTSPVATTLPQQQHHVTTLRVDRVVAASSVSEDVLYGVPYMLYDANDGGTVVVQKQQHGQPSTHANDTSHKVRGLSRKNIPQSTPAVADASLSETAAAQSSFTALTHELVARDAVLLCLVIGNVIDSEAEYHKTWCIITPSPVKPGCAMLRHIAINCTLLPSPPPPQPPSPSPAQQNGKSGNNEDVQTKKDGNPQQQQQQYGNTLAASDQQQQNEQLLLPSSLSPLPLTLTPPVLDDWETVPLSQPFSEHTNISSGIITNTAQPTTTTIPNNKSPTSVAKSSTTQRRRHNSKDFSRDRGSSRRDADSHNNGEYNNKKMVATDVSVVDLESDGRRRIDALEKYVANSQERRVRFDVPTGSQQQQPQR